MKELLQRAIETWGLEQQWRMVQEECAELIAAINRKARGRPGAEDQLLEEVVDAHIVVQQARYMLNKETSFSALMAKKLERLEQRLDHEENRRRSGLPPQGDVGFQHIEPEPLPPTTSAYRRVTNIQIDIARGDPNKDRRGWIARIQFTDLDTGRHHCFSGNEFHRRDLVSTLFAVQRLLVAFVLDTDNTR